MSNTGPTKRGEAPSEPLKRAIGVTTRAIAGDHEMLVGYAAGTPNMHGHTVQLPEPSRVPSRREIAVIRGWADSLGLMAACHNAKLHNRLAPSSGTAREVFEAVEKARVEAIGANRMAGMADNLTAKLEDHFAHGRFANVTDRDSAPLSEAMALIVRERLTGQETPENAQTVINVWRPWIEQRCATLLQKMDTLGEDQEGFGRLLRDVLTALDLAEDWGDSQLEKEATEDQPESEGGEEESEESAEGDDGQESQGDSEATESEESNIADMTIPRTRRSSMSRAMRPRRPRQPSRGSPTLRCWMIRNCSAIASTQESSTKRCRPTTCRRRKSWTGCGRFSIRK